MPEEEHTYNQIPQSPSTNLDHNYPEGETSEPKDDSFSSEPQPKPVKTPDVASVYQSPHIAGPSFPHRNEAISEFNKSSGASPLPSVLVWLSFAIVLIATGFFWLSDYSNVKAINEKENEKNSIVSQLDSANNKKIEEEAINFKNAFQELSTLTADQVSKASFLTALYTHLTRDIRITSISLSSEGEFGLDGATGSYRQVADLMLGLKTYDKLSEISLKKVAVSTEEGVETNQKIVFSISAKADLTKAGSTTNAVDNSTTSGSSTQGSTSVPSTTGASTTTTNTNP